MDREWLAERLEAGRSIESIAREVAKAPSTVGYWVNKHGLTATRSAKHAARGGVEEARLRELVERGLSIRQIAAELELSAGAVQYWLRRHELRTQPSRYRRRTGVVADSIQRECPRHGWTTYRRSARASSYRCPRCASEAVARRRRAVKEILVAEAGGACVACGYNRFPGALQFHHVDPSAKRFQLSFNGVPRAVEKLRAEARKCVLLCATCHAEVEGGFRKSPAVADTEAATIGGSSMAERSAVNR